MKKILAIVLTVAMLCAVVGCGTNSSASNPTDSEPKTEAQAAGEEAQAATEEKTVYVSINDGDPGTLDPFSGTGSAYTYATLNLYDKLFDFDEKGEVVGVMAESYERKGDTLTIHLYENIVDTEGNKFTSEDVAYCLEKFTEKATAEVASFTNVKVIDDYTFSVDIVNESVTTMRNWSGLPMVTKAAYEASGENMATKVVCTGPYKLVEYVTGSTITLEKNENYWQSEDKRQCPNQYQNADKIVYNLMTEASQIAVNLESGVVDFAFVDWSVADNFTSGKVAGNYEANEVQGWGGNDIVFNMSDQSVFKDNENLRKAILYAIDSQGIVDGVWDGHAQVPKSLGNYNYPDANPKWQDEEYFEYDIEKAKEYFGKSGYSSGALTLNLIYSSSSYTNSMAEMVQAYLGELGINVTIQGLDNAIFKEYVADASKYDIAFHGKGGGGSITTIWNKILDKNAYDGTHCVAFIDDDELQKLVVAACDPETHSQDTVDAVHYYLIDKGYLKRLYIESKCAVTNADKITEAFVNIDSRPVPGAFTYSWN